MKPWELSDPRFTLEMRLNLLACLAGEAKAEKVQRATGV